MNNNNNNANANNNNAYNANNANNNANNANNASNPLNNMVAAVDVQDLINQAVQNALANQQQLINDAVTAAHTAQAQPQAIDYQALAGAVAGAMAQNAPPQQPAVPENAAPRPPPRVKVNTLLISKFTGKAKYRSLGARFPQFQAEFEQALATDSTINQVQYTNAMKRAIMS